MANQIGFSVPNLRAVVKIKANSFKMITTSEAPAGRSSFTILGRI
jgi:hypothetical protein